MSAVSSELDGAQYLKFQQERRETLLQIIDQAAAVSGRSLEDIDCVAVSKTVDTPQVIAARQAGWTHFAENRPQELNRKLSELEELGLADAYEFDMIGNLQKNKINSILGKVRLIHSISSMHLADAVDVRCVREGLVQDVLIEVNVSGEESKSGFSPDKIRENIDKIMEMEGIAVVGLMTMAPAHDLCIARKTFSGLRELRDELKVETGLDLPRLSCGMSDDFAIAVEEGSNLIRLGRVIFDNLYNLD